MKVPKVPLDEEMIKIISRFITLLAMRGYLHGVSYLGIGYSFSAMHEWAYEQAKKLALDLVKGINQTTADYLRDAIAKWIDSGEHLSALIRELRNSGMFGPVRAQLIAETETTRAFNLGNMEAFRQGGAAGKRWYTARDDLVCEECASLHGKEVELESDFAGISGAHAHPPAHPRCRCVIFPVARSLP